MAYLVAVHTTDDTKTAMHYVSTLSFSICVKLEGLRLIFLVSDSIPTKFVEHQILGYVSDLV